MKPFRDPRKKSGELLWQARFSDANLASIKVRLGSYGYAGQYQQRPVPLGGGLFKTKWWKRYGEIPGDLERVFSSWDFAFDDLDDSSYVVGQVWGIRGADRFLLDQVRQRADFPASKAMMIALTDKWEDATAHIVEGKANGTAIIAELKSQISGILVWPPKGYKMESKIARAAAATPSVEAGNVYLPEHAPWISDFMAELEKFPRGANNDQVDAFSQAMAYARTRPGRFRLATDTNDRGEGGAYG